MLEEVKQHGASVHICTNGMLVTREVAERLVALELDILTFSLDAATPELFREIRRGGDLDRVMRNIRTLNEIKRRVRRDGSPVLGITFCAMKRNIRELPDLVRLADRLNMTFGVSIEGLVEHDGTSGESLSQRSELAATWVNEAYQVAVRLAVPLGLTPQFVEVVQPPVITLTPGQKLARYRREFERSFNRKSLFRAKLAGFVQRLGNGLGRNDSVNGSLPWMDGKTHSAGYGPQKVRRCSEPWDSMFVDAAGNVRVCCVSHRIMGNVNRDDVASIWDGPRYREFRKRMVRLDLPGECRTCPRKPWQTIQ